MTPSPGPDEGVGCRPSALAALGLLVWALALGGVGLWLVDTRATGLALFYGAAPFSAVFGVIGGHLTVAWPLDLMAWVVAGVVATAWSNRSGRPRWQTAAAIAVLSLVFGFLMSLLVEVNQLVAI